jgi:Domain of unknown function (DUF4397)
MRGKLVKVLSLGAALLCVASLLLGAACGNGSGARFRYVQAATGSPGTNVDVDVDNNKVLTGIAYGSAGTYQNISSGSRQFEVFLTNTTTNPFFNGSVPLNKGDNTVVTDGTFGTIGMDVFTDDNVAPTSGDVKIKFIHVAPSAGVIDIYVVPTGQGIGGLAPQISSLSYKSATALKPLISAGAYEVVMTQTGTQNPVSGLDVTYTWTAGQVRTIVILDNSPGGSPYQQLVLTDAN